MARQGRARPGPLRLITKAWTGGWTAGSTGEFARAGVRDLGGAGFAATRNAAEWGALGTVASRPASGDPGFAGRLAEANFAQAEIDLRAAGAAISPPAAAPIG